jgi:hypothetical protein
MDSMSDRAEQTPEDMNDAIGPDVHIPGPYPSGRGDPTGEPLTSEPEPTKETRSPGSLGDLTKEISTSTIREETGGLGSPLYEEHTEEPEQDTSQEEIEKARAESFPGGVPEDADVGTGRAKGTGLPPGSVGKGHDTPQTPVT